MEHTILRADVRDVVGKKVNSFRKTGRIPAVVYGHKVASRNVWVDELEFQKVYDKAGESAIVELAVDEGKKVNVLIHDLQREPLSGKVSHIDFFQVRMDEEVETEIPLEFIGEAPIVKEQGGILIKNFDKIPVRCLPADLPEGFNVDLVKLAAFDSHIAIADLVVPAKVKVLLDPETVLVSVEEPRAEEELAKLDEKVEIDVSQVEKIEKEKKEAEEAAESESK